MSERRDSVPFDPYYFERLQSKGAALSREETFRHIRESRFWAGSESVSGIGSGRDQTDRIKAVLPRLVEDLGVDTLLDVPCGDFAWMRDVELPISRYVGGDIITELIEENQAAYGDERRQFVVLDLITDILPPAELLFCRDALVHMSFSDIRSALRNVASGEVTYLLTTTFPQCRTNEDITTGDWRVLNLELPPFSLPPPERLINEGCTEGGGRFSDKSLGLWRVSDLADAPFVKP